VPAPPSIDRSHGTRIAPPDERESRERTPDQRVYGRFPAIYRLSAALTSLLPPGSSVRRRVLGRQMRRTYAAANRGDFELVLIGIADDFEYRPSRDLMPPDMPPVFHGHEGYVAVWRHWLDAFEDIRWDPEEVIDLGDRMLVTTHQRGHGAGSGIGLTEPVFQVFEMRRGLVVRQSDFLDRAEAMRAAGLSAAAPSCS
jgi:ketosteroid isomerase-like protein